MIIIIFVATFDMSGARKLRPHKVKSKHGARNTLISNCGDIRNDGSGLIDLVEKLAICSKLAITRYLAILLRYGCFDVIYIYTVG